MRQSWLIGTLFPLVMTQPPAPVPGGTGSTTRMQEAPSPFSHIEYKHERTFLNIDVVQLDIRVAEEVGREVERLVEAYHTVDSGSPAASQAEPRSGHEAGSGPGAREALQDSIANAYMHTPTADVSMVFLRSVSHRQFMGGRDDTLEAMVEGELLTDADAEALAEDTNQLFAFLRSAPLRSGHEIRYSVRGDTVRTWVIWEDGTVALDVVRTTRRHRLYTMGSLFAPGTEFRDGLLETVLDASLASGR